MYAIGIDPTLTDTVPRFTPGTVAANLTSAGMKKYKYVKYNSGAGTIAAVAGNVAYYYAPSGASAGATTEVTSDLSDSANLGAGVLQAVIANGSYGWVQIKGPATITPALTAGADGQALTAAGAGADGTLDVSAAATDEIVAYAIDASAKIIMCDFPE
jgi:hypothetical protein